MASGAFGLRDKLEKLLCTRPELAEWRFRHYSCMCLAAQWGHLRTAELLLDKSADIEAVGRDGRTPLAWAAGEGHDAIVRLLLDNGSDIEAKGESGRTPLSWAAGEGHDANVRQLLHNGSEIE